jgi:hypothetical protein
MVYESCYDMPLNRVFRTFTQVFRNVIENIKGWLTNSSQDKPGTQATGDKGELQKDNTLTQPQNRTNVSGNATAPKKPLKVFINAASEDREIAAEMGDFLKRQGINYVPPLDFANQAPTEIRNHLKANLEKSDVMILLLGDAPLEWIHQLSYCQRLATTLLDHPIKWVIYSKKLNKDFSNYIPVVEKFDELNRILTADSI